MKGHYVIIFFIFCEFSNSYKILVIENELEKMRIFFSLCESVTCLQKAKIFDFLTESLKFFYAKCFFFNISKISCYRIIAD